ncbi:unnamed protein product [Kuraishia capsulata CBS 1993]|uniref:Cargo-transport protein YPP1 n=1 Tax=Kuraishia capsulata CBS 1993 TaxID=1382522 RepID=W6MVQ1_9ASCO|nr:uncharacterized protein KUCA_T00002392001 [Kuraishia capsulata CBS 1993]CDK26420.1 unnamed protein product [Kuraishia capsulata CBS 1993]
MSELVTRDVLRSQLLVKGSRGIIANIDDLSNEDSILQLAQFDTEFEALGEKSAHGLKNVEVDAQLYNFKLLLLAEQEDVSILKDQSFQDPSEFEYYVYLRSLKLLLDRGVSELVPEYLKAWSVFSGFPRRTNLLGTAMFEDVLTGLATYFVSIGVKSTAQVESSFDSYVTLTTPFTRLLRLRFVSRFAKLQGNQPGLTQHLLELEKNYAQGASFPKASETNFEYDEYMKAILDITILDGNLSAASLGSQVDAALSKTFQSAVVMRAWLSSCALDLSKTAQEVHAAFNVYLNYSLKEKGLGGGVFSDIIDVLDCFEFVLNYFVSRAPEIDLIPSIADWNLKMKDIINEFKISYDIDSTKPLSEVLAQRLSSYYYTLGAVERFLAVNGSPTLKLLETHLANSYAYLTESIEIAHSHGIKASFDAYFQHAIVSGKLNKTSIACKSAKQCIGVDPTSFKALNLLVLLLTSKDPRDLQALTVAEAANQMIENYLEESGSLTPVEKWELIEFRKTYVAAKEIHEGIFAALDHVPEVFTLFHTLFNPSEISNGEVKSYVPQLHAGGLSSQKDVQWSHRPSIVNPSAETEAVQNGSKHERKKSLLSAVRSTGSLAEKKLSFDSRKSKHELKNKPSSDLASLYSDTSVKEPLQDIWLWASRLYEKAGMLEESEKCIKEAESCHKPNFKTHARFGLLVYKANPKLAFQEFEISLDEVEEENVESILGLTLLSFSEEAQKAGVFISEKDKWSAQARVLNYLENLAKQYKYSQSSEVYYLLSQLYKLYGDTPKFEHSLLKTIELEECKPLRPWSVVEKPSFFA